MIPPSHHHRAQHHHHHYQPGQVKTALVNKDLKKAGEMEIKKLDQLLSQVFMNVTVMMMLMTTKVTIRY